MHTLYSDFLWRFFKTIMGFCLMMSLSQTEMTLHPHHVSFIGGIFFSFWLCCGSKHPPNSVAEKQGFFPTHGTCPPQVRRGAIPCHHVMCSLRDADSKWPARKKNLAGHHGRQSGRCRIWHWLLRFSLKCDTSSPLTLPLEKEVTWSHRAKACPVNSEEEV